MFGFTPFRSQRNAALCMYDDVKGSHYRYPFSRASFLDLLYLDSGVIVVLVDEMEDS